MPSVEKLPDESFERVLCVAAHPDDLEYGTSAAVSIWTARGVEVRYLLLTRGEAGMDALDPAETRPLRTAEQIAAGAAVGVQHVDFLDHPDGQLEYGLPVRRDVARVIREFRPDVVVTLSWELEFIGGLNMADHRVTGLVVLDAVRDAGNRWVFTDLLDAGLEPWSVRWFLVAGHGSPTHGVDITGEPLERGIASLEAHERYFAGLPDQPPLRSMLTGLAGWQGPALGVEHATLFRAWDFQAPPDPFDGAESKG